MRRVFFPTLLVLVFLGATVWGKETVPGPATAGGLQEGAKVRITAQGKTFAGTITSFHLDEEPLLILKPSGESVHIPLREIRSIRATGKEQRIILQLTIPQEETYPLLEFRTLDGRHIEGSVDQDLVFSIYVSSEGVEKDFDIDELEQIEVQ